jgi:hypothetical protein
MCGYAASIVCAVHRKREIKKHQTVKEMGRDDQKITAEGNKRIISGCSS